MEDRKILLPPLLSLGEVLRRQNRLLEAEQVFRKAAEDYPARASRALFDLGVLLFHQERFNEAEEVYRQVVAGGDVELVPLALTNLADVQRSLAHLDEAETSCRAALATDDERHMALAARFLGEILEEHGRLEEAAQAYRLAMVHPDMEHGLAHSTEAAFSLARLLEAEGRYREGREVLAQVVSGAPEMELRAREAMGFNFVPRGPTG